MRFCDAIRVAVLLQVATAVWAAESGCTDTGYVCSSLERGDTEYCQKWAEDSMCDGSGACVSPVGCFTDVTTDAPAGSVALLVLSILFLVCCYVPCCWIKIWPGPHADPEKLLEDTHCYSRQGGGCIYFSDGYWKISPHGEGGMMLNISNVQHWRCSARSTSARISGSSRRRGQRRTCRWGNGTRR